MKKIRMGPPKAQKSVYFKDRRLKRKKQKDRRRILEELEYLDK